MRINDIRIGEHYSLHSNPTKLTAEALGVDYFGYPSVKLRAPSGQLTEASARHLTPWSEFETQQLINQSEAEEMEDLARKLIGDQGKVQAEHYYRDIHHLRFDEEAAEALLTGLGRKPLSDNCRPSKIKDRYEREEAQLRLARRVRHALKEGATSERDIELVDSSGMACQIEISLLGLSGTVKHLKGDNLGESEDKLADILG